MFDVDDLEHQWYRAEAWRLWALWKIATLDLTEPEVFDLTRSAQPVTPTT